jgi:hypothetical protein
MTSRRKLVALAARARLVRAGLLIAASALLAAAVVAGHALRVGRKWSREE